MKNLSLYRLISRFSKQEINVLFAKSKRFSFSPLWDVRFSQSIFSYGKILFIINKKVGSAPVRNKIRRQIKAVFFQEKLYKYGISLICIIKKPSVFLSFTALKQKFMEMFHDYNISQNNN